MSLWVLSGTRVHPTNQMGCLEAWTVDAKPRARCTTLVILGTKLDIFRRNPDLSVGLESLLLLSFTLLLIFLLLALFFSIFELLLCWLEIRLLVDVHGFVFGGFPGTNEAVLTTCECCTSL